MESSTSKSQGETTSYASYRELNTTSLSRSESLRRERDSSQSALWRKWYIWLSVIVVVGAIGAGLWWWLSARSEPTTSSSVQKAVVSSKASQQSQEEDVPFSVPSKEDRAQVKLVDPIEVNNKIDVYEISNAKQVYLRIESNETTKVEVRATNSTGKPFINQTLEEGSMIEQKQGQTLYVKIAEPNAVNLWVNGVSLASSEKGVYQFRLASDAEE